jgi:hypothetical protein
VALRPQQRRHDGTEDAKLGEALGEVGERLTGEQATEARCRRDPRNLRLDRFDGEHEAVLHEVAGHCGDAEQHEQNAELGADIHGQRFRQRRQPETVGRDQVGFGAQTAQRRLQTGRHRRREHHDQKACRRRS